MPKEVIFGIGEEYLAHAGLKTTVEVWEDGMRTSPAKGDFEWWYFDAHFSDGSTAVIVFFTKPLLNPAGPLSPGVSLTITTPQGEKLFKFITTAPDDFSCSRQGCDIRVHKSRVWGNLKSYVLHVEAGDLQADLELQDVVPAWRPGSGINYYDEDLTLYFGWLPAIPHGLAQGVLAYQGRQVKVQGFCYHDHNWGNVNLARVMSHWYWGRAHVGNFTTIFVEMYASQAYGGVKIPVFLLARDELILTDEGQFLSMHIDDEEVNSSLRSYPRQARFVWQKGSESVNVVLSRPQMIESISLLGTLPTWKRYLARLVANPFYLRFNTQVDLDVNLHVIHRRVTGNGLYEVMYLK